MLDACELLVLVGGPLVDVFPEGVVLGEEADVALLDLIEVLDEGLDLLVEGLGLRLEPGLSLLLALVLEPGLALEVRETRRGGDLAQALGGRVVVLHVVLVEDGQVLLAELLRAEAAAAAARLARLVLRAAAPAAARRLPAPAAARRAAPRHGRAVLVARGRGHVVVVGGGRHLRRHSRPSPLSPW